MATVISDRVRINAGRAVGGSAIGLAVAALAPSAYLALLAAVAYRTNVTPLARPRPTASIRPTRFVVCVPAHNEESTIRRVVMALRNQVYDRRRVQVHVVADNCSDDTAAIASEAGARVHVRIDEVNPGKGAAQWFAGAFDGDR